MSRHSFGIYFDTLEHMAGEAVAILYVRPFIFPRFFLLFLKFSLIFLLDNLHIQPLNRTDMSRN